MEALESIAHTLRGGTTIFFFAWATALYRFRRRSRLMQLIYWGSLVLGFSYLKDSLFLFPQFQDVPFWNDLVSLSDLICVPMACSFCIEAVRPGTSTNRRIAPFLLFHVLCVLSYAVWPGRVVFFSAFVIAFLQVAVTVGLVIVYAGRYRRLLRDNYSSIEQRDVVWIVQFALGYFGLYVAYFVAFETTSWLSESIFSVLICIVWSYLSTIIPAATVSATSQQQTRQWLSMPYPRRKQLYLLNLPRSPSGRLHRRGKAGTAF